MEAGNRQVLLLFKKGGSRTTQTPHDGDGELHLAFAIPAAECTSWEAWLAENGSRWKRSGRGSWAARASMLGIQLAAR